MEINPNVDDLLAEQRIGKPLDALPEQPQEVSRETVESMGLPSTEPKVEALAPKVESPKLKVEAKAETNEYGEPQTKVEPKADQESTTDEYGLEAEAEKLYTKAELNEQINRAMRERLARLERNNPPPQQPMQQQQQAQSQGFQYDENSNLDWQQQLENFTMQVIDKRENMRAQQIQQAKEHQRMSEFEQKFKQGMDKFSDYHEVVGKFRIQDDMLMATEDINNPAALFYVAAKRMPEELSKICQIESPLARAAAIGRLDAKLRKDAPKSKQCT